MGVLSYVCLIEYVGVGVCFGGKTRKGLWISGWISKSVGG